MDQIYGSSSQDRLPQPVPGGLSLTTEGRRNVDFSHTIRGWGSDLDPARRPGVPRDKKPDLGVEALYPPIPQQVPKVKIHKSTEHGRLTPVFGTACPPTGLSGRIRDYAYTISEGRLARWLALMVADRVNVAEDLVGDLAKGRLPNIPKEMGWKSEWQYNRDGFIRKAAIVAGGATLLYLLMSSRSRK